MSFGVSTTLGSRLTADAEGKKGAPFLTGEDISFRVPDLTS